MCTTTFNDDKSITEVCQTRYNDGQTDTHVEEVKDARGVLNYLKRR
jgi:hypothetical protein